jgi:hypothetical protein
MLAATALLGARKWLNSARMAEISQFHIYNFFPVAEFK